MFLLFPYLLYYFIFSLTPLYANFTSDLAQNESWTFFNTSVMDVFFFFFFFFSVFICIRFFFLFFHHLHRFRFISIFIFIFIFISIFISISIFIFIFTSSSPSYLKLVFSLFSSSSSPSLTPLYANFTPDLAQNEGRLLKRHQRYLVRPVSLVLLRTYYILYCVVKITDIWVNNKQNSGIIL